MPRIFDNLTPATRLRPALQQVLAESRRTDFCIGYFNLRGWQGLARHVDRWGPADGPCRILVGMQRLPHDELIEALGLLDQPPDIDPQKVMRLKTRLADQFRQQLTMGVPSNEEESALRRLATQLRAGKVRVKLFLRHSLHAKLYLVYRDDPVTPIVGYLGSSNLTYSGLAGQGELNVDVVEHDATRKLQRWFEDRWEDRHCVDITSELIAILEESWARAEPVPPYHIYLKMAYHLSREARAGLSEFKIPKVFGDELFDFQTAAVKIAAHHITRRGGVLVGDVVGLGKTLMAAAVARIFQDDLGLETLIICPKNLVDMWEDYVHRYRLVGKVLSLSQYRRLRHLRRYRLVVIDESHNLRNPQSARYRAVREYVRENESKCMLLTATPYNKTYHDLSGQLGIFIEPDQDLGIRPERLLRDLGEAEFGAKHRVGARTLGAFRKSEHADDWRELMRLYLVRRTRSFIQRNYARLDPENGRRYLEFANGERSYFPKRVPRTVTFAVDETDPGDRYAQLYSDQVVDAINSLELARYGLGQHVRERPAVAAKRSERDQIRKLSKAGRRLMGFCRTNLFKRLESSGEAFVRSVERHIVRNHVFLHALDEGLALPIGSQDSELLDLRFADDDAEAAHHEPGDDQAGHAAADGAARERTEWSTAGFKARAANVYRMYRGAYRRRFRWLRAELFKPSLKSSLRRDTQTLERLLRQYGDWDPARDAKLDALHRLAARTFRDRKVLVFSQFADTVDYLAAQLTARGVEDVAGVTGGSANPTDMARRFSPRSNERHAADRAGSAASGGEIRVLIATDLLSEGQNLQDCHIVVNYDLPWAIVRLIQRAGRVDRIGQRAEEIECHSFLPAQGVERIIRLRGRVRNRLRENREVVGTDEAFFADEADDQPVLDLYNEKAGILDGETDGEVDLASQAYQIWKNATEDDPDLEKAVVGLPNVVYSSRDHSAAPTRPEGVLVFMRTAGGHDALAYVDRRKRSITESQLEILKAAECDPDTPAQPRRSEHHSLVAAGVRHVGREERRIEGQLGRPSGARYRVYQRLEQHLEKVKDGLFDIAALHRAMDEMRRRPLLRSATDTLNRQMRSGADDAQLAAIVAELRDGDRLCVRGEEDEEVRAAPRIICSMGLFEAEP